MWDGVVAQVIKKPMDLGTIQTKLTSGKYRSAAAVVADIGLVFANAMEYNEAGDEIHEAAKRMAKQTDKKLAPLGFQLEGVDTSGRKRKQEDEGEGEGGRARKAQKKEDGATAKGTGEDIEVGTMVKMLFDDGKWYKGTIDKYLKSKNLYTVVFSDGDRQNTKIPADDVQVLTASGKVKATPRAETPAAKDASQTTTTSTSRKKAAPNEASDKSSAAVTGWKEDVRELLEWIVELIEAEAFLEPVDPEALGIPDYFQVGAGCPVSRAVSSMIRVHGIESRRRCFAVVTPLALYCVVIVFIGVFCDLRRYLNIGCCFRSAGDRNPDGPWHGAAQVSDRAVPDGGSRGGRYSADVFKCDR
eukprot:3169136-Rhodomonas_salina.1